MIHKNSLREIYELPPNSVHGFGDNILYQPSIRSIRGNICSDVQGVWLERSEVHVP